MCAKCPDCGEATPGSAHTEDELRNRVHALSMYLEHTIQAAEAHGNEIALDRLQEARIFIRNVL